MNSISIETLKINNLIKSKVTSSLQNHILGKFKKQVEVLSIKDFKILKKLGQGAYGKVYLVDHKDK